MENPIIAGRVVKFYELWSIRNPEDWIAKNPGAAKIRFTIRKELQKKLPKHGIQYAEDDQLVFVAFNTDGTHDILEGEILSRNRLSIGEDLLIVDETKERVLLEDPDLRTWQSTSDGWIRARIRDPKKKIGVTELDLAVAAAHQKAKDLDDSIADIRARKAALRASLEPIFIGTQNLSEINK